jgi:hypothetical protein
MKNLCRLVLLATLLSTLHVSAASTAKTYQVTGKIVSVTAELIVVQKGDTKYELSRKTKTKGLEKAKVGDTVTVTYHMVAETVEAKPEGK